jgi:uncharacterized protein (TIGR02266 family)
MLPGARNRAGAPTFTVSGLHPRVARNDAPGVTDEIEALDPAAVLEQKLADTEVELEAVRRERDALGRRLADALAELSELKQPAPDRFVAPDVPEPQPVLLDDEDMHLIATVPPAEPTPAPTRLQPRTTGELSRVVVSSSERRRGERLDCEFEVEFLSDTHFMTGITQDLSEGGIFIATYQQLPVGTQVELAFELPGEQRVETKGEVRWSRNERGDTRPGIGIAFTELSHAALASITAYCAGGTSRYYEF